MVVSNSLLQNSEHYLLNSR